MNTNKSKRKKALIIVDVQPIFLNQSNKHVLKYISNLISSTTYDLYINAVFYAHPKSIWQKQTRWSVPKEDAKTHSNIQALLDKKENVINVVKQTKSVFKGKINSRWLDGSIEDIFNQKGIKEVHIIGLDTNDCVLATAYEAFDLGYYTYVIEECVQSSEGNEIHKKAIDLLRHVGLTNNCPK